MSSNGSTSSRLFRTDLQTKLKKDMQDKLDREKMARDFPFHPQINEWNFAGREDVLSHLQQKEQQRMAKIAAMQQQRVMDLQQSVSSAPQISPYSKSLSFDQPVHLRLYSIAAARIPPSPDNSETQSPRPRSVSNSSVDFAKLYEDAKIRQLHRERALQKEKYEQDSQSNSKKVVGRSLTILLQKTDKDIQKITNLIWEGANSSGIITEALLADALLSTGYFKMDLTEDPNGLRSQQEVKALKKLCEYLQAKRQQKQEDGEEINDLNGSDPMEDGIDAADAIDFMTVLLQRSAPTEENRRKNEEPPIIEEDHLVRRYLKLLSTARAYETDKKKGASLPPEYTFRPTLNRKSLLLDTVEKEKDKEKEGSPSPKRYEKLYELSGTTGEKLSTIRKEKEKKSLSECTFHPKVNRNTPAEELDGMRKSEALFNMSKAKKNKKNKKEGEEDLPSHVARELKHCSFSPNLESTKRSLEVLKRGDVDSPRGADRFVERIQQAHSDREQLQQLLERPSYPKPSALKGKPPSFLTTRAKPAWEPPLLYVDIKLAHGRTGRIGIHKGDDPKVLAQNFANAFHLDSKLTGKLVDMLQMHIDNLENLDEELEMDDKGSRPGSRKNEEDGDEMEEAGGNNRYADGEYSFNSGVEENY